MILKKTPVDDNKNMKNYSASKELKVSTDRHTTGFPNAVRGDALCEM